MSDEVKMPWQSKTVLANAVIGVAPLIPGVSDWIAHNPEGFGFALGLFNVLLRFVTEKKIAFSWPM